MADTATHHRTASIEGLDVFYREAGDRSNPTLLILHVFPSSSRMFRNLIAALADDYHLVSPDLIGYFRTHQPPLLVTWDKNDEISGYVREFLARQESVR